MKKLIPLTTVVCFILLTLSDASAQIVVPKEFDCLIKPTQTIELSSGQTGVIDKIHVDKGDLIKKGQVIAELESSVERASVALAKAKAMLDDDIKSKKENLAHSKRKYERISELYGKHVVSFSEKDEIETTVSLAEYDLSQAIENKHLAMLEYERRKKILERMTITSPINGAVVERYVSKGEAVKNKDIVKVVQLDPLRVDVIVPGELFGDVKIGMQAKIIPEGDRDIFYIAEVNVADKVIDASSGTFDVRLSLANPDYKIAGGTHCKIQFMMNSDDKVNILSITPE